MEEKKTMKFEIHDIHLINALGHFAHHLSKEETNMLRIDLGETISDDNHNIRVGVGTQPVSFTFEGNDFYIHCKQKNILQMYELLSSHSMD